MLASFLFWAVVRIAGLVFVLRSAVHALALLLWALKRYVGPGLVVREAASPGNRAALARLQARARGSGTVCRSGVDWRSARCVVRARVARWCWRRSGRGDPGDDGERPTPADFARFLYVTPCHAATAPCSHTLMEIRLC
jgi:hypothetical protein